MQINWPFWQNNDDDMHFDVRYALKQAIDNQCMDMEEFDDMARDWTPEMLFEWTQRPGSETVISSYLS